ncbi:MAG: hypothetical protein ACI8X5_003950 [Planctomycetota bacterium]|jgi:hypothetical protein
MHPKLMAALILTLLLVAPSVALSEDSLPIDPNEIVMNTFNNLYGFSSIQQVEVSTGTQQGESFTRSAQVVRAGAAEGLNRMLVRFKDPMDLRGVGILLKERENFQYDAFMYQPALKKIRRVSVYQRNDQFFGTDLSFEDLEGKRAKQWGARLLRSEEMLGRKTWVIELTPIGFPSGYKKIVGWFDQEIPVIVHFEYVLSGKGDEIYKTVDLDPGAVVEKGGYFIPTRLKFSGSQGTQTVVNISGIEILEVLPKKLFSPTSLERGDVRSDASKSKQK